MKFWLACLAATGSIWVTGSTVQADTIELTGVIRDFQASHPDFESFVHWQFSQWYETEGPALYSYKGLVESELDDAGLPVAIFPTQTLTLGEGSRRDAQITVTFSQTSIGVTSTKDLSNVVLELDDGTHHKYDNLSIGRSSTFVVPLEHEGKAIVGAWVKSGRNASGDGPGYGRRFRMSNATADRLVPFTSQAHFRQWYTDVPDVNIAIPHTIVLDNGREGTEGVYTFAMERPTYFFPIDEVGFGLSGRGADNRDHNFHWTFEVRTTFVYTDPTDRDYPLVFTFTGDDDVWVFINGKLAVDLGGVHPQASDSVNLDTAAATLGLEPGNEYTLDVFMAERHTNESNFRIDTTLQLQGVPPTTVSPGYD